MNVNAKSALTLSAFYNAVDIITNDYANLPQHVFQKTKEGRIKIGEHPVQHLIGTAPNQYMTPFMFDKVLLLNAILKGNGYALIERNPYTAAPIALQLIDQDKTPVTVIINKEKLYYKVAGKMIPAENMYHIPGFSLNGITGIGVVAFAAHSLGVNLSSQEFAGDYYNSKGIGTAIITSSKSMQPEVKKAYGEAVASI